MKPDKSKCDEVLGLRVQEHLLKLKLQTPVIETHLRGDDEEKIKDIRAHMKSIWSILGMDLQDDSLRDTPNRIAKMFVNELFWGLKPEYFPKCTTIENKMGYDEMLVERGIRVMSACEHHGVTIDGKATVAYIPKAKVIGLSKINRIVDYFSRRPQVQERLTVQIAEALKYILDTNDVAVSITAKHYCVISRGIEDAGSETTSTSLNGAFIENESTRKEFTSLIRN